MCHLAANFYRRFRNKKLMNIFKRLCNHNQQKKFDELWKWINEFTKKEQREHNTEDKTHSLCDLPRVDSPSTRRRPLNRVKCFTHWIIKDPLEKWFLLHDTNVAKYDIMTSNLAKVCNYVLRKVRSLPLVGIVEWHL